MLPYDPLGVHPTFAVVSYFDRMPQAYFRAAFDWAAANGGVTNGGLRGVWPPFPEIGRNRLFFFCYFLPFSGGTKSTWEIQKTEEKGLFPQISSDLLEPPSLKPPSNAALQFDILQVFREWGPAGGGADHNAGAGLATLPAC